MVNGVFGAEIVLVYMLSKSIQAWMRVPWISPCQRSSLAPSTPALAVLTTVEPPQMAD